MTHLNRAVHRTILMVDIEGFGNPLRNQINQVKVRTGLYRVLQEAFRDSWDECWQEGTGDGALVLAPPSIPKSWLVDNVIQTITALLSKHNAAHPREEEIRLRMVLHAGEVVFDGIGATSPAIVFASRLLDTRPLRAALAKSPGVSALITSDWFFEEVVRHSQGTDPSAFRKVAIKLKETSAMAWVGLPERIGVRDLARMASTYRSDGRSGPRSPRQYWIAYGR